ncbi:MAG: D-2-hydroxyacid dehydrogenase [Clostridia bacterium]|nr:D-2-hydroxyacid dehydrogenase [Clostridia bacterium]
MKIVVVDKPKEYSGEIDWSEVEKLGDARVYDKTSQENIASVIGDAEIVMINKGKITKEILEKCPNIKFISLIATGYDRIDLEETTKRGIIVSNVPSYGSKAIGQHAVALLLEITNNVAHHSNEVKKLRNGGENEWCFWDYPIYEIEYKTIGVIGLGRIGKTFASAGLAMGAKVIAYDAFECEDMKNMGVEFVSLDDLFARSDIISLHCPLTNETEQLINKENISKMKDGVIIINNSRGALVNEQDLADALKSGKVYSAGIDVLTNEPLSEDNPLLTAPNCVITPHISWAALDTRRRLARLAIENVKAYLDGNPINIVNKK